MLIRAAINCLIAGMLLLGAGAAYSQDSRIYIGASAGQSSVDEGVVDDDDTSYKVFGGLGFSEHFAVELGYVDFGSFEARPITAPPGLVFDFDVSGVYGNVVGLLPFTRNFYGFAKLGLSRWEAGTPIADLTGADDSGFDIMGGVGVQYLLNNQFALRGEFERFEVDEADMDLWSFGVLFKF